MTFKSLHVRHTQEQSRAERDDYNQNLKTVVYIHIRFRLNKQGKRGKCPFQQFLHLCVDEKDFPPFHNVETLYPDGDSDRV